MNVMRVDNPEQNHDHGFGLGAGDSDPHDVSAADHTAVTHGLFEHVDADPVADPGAHSVFGHIEHDFGSHHDTGFDGLHDSVHSVGLGFGGGEEHGLHDSLHDTSHDPGQNHHVPVEHHDVGLGGAEHFHHG
jgi:hypothetical protein